MEIAAYFRALASARNTDKMCPFNGMACYGEAFRRIAKSKKCAPKAKVRGSSPLGRANTTNNLAAIDGHDGNAPSAVCPRKTLPTRSRRELSVYDGRTFLGRIIERDGECRAFAAEGRKLGIFASVKAAAGAVGSSHGGVQ